MKFLIDVNQFDSTAFFEKTSEQGIDLAPTFVFERGLRIEKHKVFLLTDGTMRIDVEVNRQVIEKAISESILQPKQVDKELHSFMVGRVGQEPSSFTEFQELKELGALIDDKLTGKKVIDHPDNWLGEVE